MAKGKGKGKFDKKTAVKFTLIPGPMKQGKPTVLFKPVESKIKSKLTKKQRKDYISQLSDYEQITINGRVVGEDEIPAFILQQIRGRGDLTINQKIQEEMVGDLYELEDRKDDEEDDYQEYPDYEDQRMEIIKERKEDDDQEFQEQGEWEDYSGDEQQENEVLDEEQQEQNKKYQYKQQDFPSIKQLQKVEVDGITYQMTKQQIKLLDQLIPDNYQQLDFGGLQFKKYNEDGLPLSDQAKFDKYLLKDGDGTVVVDTYEYVPEKPLDIIDNDLKPSQINGNREVKQVEEALNFNGEEEVYEELEDDFFAKMIQDQLSNNKAPVKPKKQEKKEIKPKTTPIPQQKIKKNQIYSSVQEIQQKLLSEKLDKALYNFQNNIQQHKEEVHKQQSDDSQQESQQGNKNISMNFTDIQKRQQYIGRDGELDWRCLSKKQKKQYMKTKIIRQYYDQLRQRQIQQKMQGKKNVLPEQLHLKQLVKHITYEQDHVMRKALEDQLKAPLKQQIEEESDYSSASQDDIISYHQKTSIIASNLSIIEEPYIKKPKRKEQDKNEEQPVENSRIKVIPEKRIKNQTKQQRKQRKQRLKEMKKLKKQQKKQFAQQFSKMRRQTNKQQNHTNPLNKVSYVKIY